jgi:predicted nucleic acid-binding protein
MKIDRYLLDTNILLRFKNPSDQDHPAATAAIVKLLRTGVSLHTCPQNMIEYRVVATRPIANNGYGLTSSEAAQNISDHEAMFPILLDSAVQVDIYPIWRRYVEGAGTLGKTNHDARLLAVAEAHACSHLLTFNGQDFQRYTQLAPHIAIVNPHHIK